jgi:hypothetical protein
VDRKDGYSNIDVRIFVIDVSESAVENVVGITHQLELTRLFSQAILSK